MKVFNTVLFLIFNLHLSGQISLHEDIIIGGTCGDGYNCSFSNDIGVINLNIPPNSVIKKAILFTTMWQDPNPTTLYLNGNLISLNSLNALPFNYIADTGGYPYKISIIYNDVTPLIQPATNSHTIIPPQNQPFNAFLEGGYSGFYLYVIFENPTLSKTAIKIFQNTQDANHTVSYSLNNINPIDLNYNIALTLNSSWICDTLGDGSYVKINNQPIGLIGGQEDNTNWYCTGSKGSFYYQNNTTYGTGNDTPDEFMAGPDVLANIESYLTSTTSFDVSFVYQNSNSNAAGAKTNPIHQLLLAYTTTCDTFTVSVPNDSTICSGESLQLNVLGGQSYEWSSLSSSSAALADLSCTNCPNPVFSGDTSRFYTVRIWNNDSCSVVRPIKINVRPKPTIASLNIQASECGTASGSIQLNVSSGTSTPIAYTLNGTSQSANTFNDLASDSYTLSFTNANGCVSKDTVVFIPEVISAIANFTVSPDHGVSPLMVSISNESINATDYIWSINGTDYGNTLSSFTFDTSGIYTVELLAWQYDPSCTDTFFISINVIDSLIIPTMITPNDDGKNDEWILQNIDQLYPENEVVIFNRWGSIVFESEKGKYEIKPWEGTHKGKNLPMGTYFYIIRTGVSETLKGYVSVLR